MARTSETSWWSTSFLKDFENVLSVKEIMHLCMIMHDALKLFKHRNCFKTVVLITSLPGSSPDLNVCKNL